MRMLAVALLVTLLPSALPVPPADPAVAELLRDYIGLYQRDTLPRWRELFQPGFVAASTNPDGSISVRSLDEFYERQRRFFETGQAVSEVLENTRVERRGRLASVVSDFVWTGGELTRRGRLVLVLVEEQGKLRVQSLAFSYD